MNLLNHGMLNNKLQVNFTCCCFLWNNITFWFWLFSSYLLLVLSYLPKHFNIATHVAKGAFMSLLSLAYISEESPCRRSPGKPSRLMILSRFGGTMDMQRWKSPYPKLTAPFSLFSESSVTPSAAIWLSFAASEVKDSWVVFFWYISWSVLMSV